jgi:hypothetical protein
MIDAVLPLVTEPFDRASLERGIAAALSSAQTHVFFDTSTLVWLYRLHEAARKEISDWATGGPQAGQVRIPRRVLHEFSRHRRNGSVLLPFRQQLSSLPRLLQQLDQWAHLITDDARASRHGFASRADYFAEIKKTTKDLESILKPIISENSIEDLDTELISLFNSIALDTNIYENLSNLQREYEARTEVRMPPGFKDAKKGKSNELELKQDDAIGAHTPDTYGTNRFGDFAIWHEILTYCSSLENKCGAVIILTHDQKPDWSYTPQKIIDLDGRIKPNAKDQLRVTVAHPLLSHEARLRAEIPDLFIISVPQLAWVTNQHKTGLSMVALSRAVQAEVEADVSIAQEGATTGAVAEEQLTSTPSTKTDAKPEEPVETTGDQKSRLVADAAAFLASAPEQATADRLFVRDPSGSKGINQVITKLKSLNWYTQNPAATEGMQALRAGEATQLQAFILGRNIYQSACGSAGTPISILENLLDALTLVQDELAIVFYAGALFEAYFDKDGAIRAQPKSRQLTPLFALQDEDRFNPAIRWFRDRIKSFENFYLALPSTHPTIKHLKIDFDSSHQITAISSGSIILTESWDDHYLGMQLPPEILYEKLRDRIAQHFALPLTQFILEGSYDGRAKVPALQLRKWGPKTHLTFPRNE